MEIRGGARADCDAKRFDVGFLESGAATQPSTFGAKTGANDDCGSADCDVVTARQQS